MGHIDCNSMDLYAHIHVYVVQRRELKKVVVDSCSLSRICWKSHNQIFGSHPLKGNIGEHKGIDLITWSGSVLLSRLVRTE